MLQINDVSKQFAGRSLFKNITLQVGPTERIGLVGRNGTGKSTLFKIILGQLQPDAGSVGIPRGYKIVALEQHIRFTKPTVLEECAQALSEDLKYETYRVEKVLFGLGFSQEDLQKSPDSFSGGYQIRMNLCKAIVSEPNLLLLDEPTNYLDIVSLRWLSQFLKSFNGEIMLITHDRDFMDSVVTHVAGLQRGGLRKISGNTGKYYEQLLMEDAIYEKTKANQDKKRAQLQRFVDRFKAKATKARQAQSKAKLIEKMGQMEKLEEESNLSFSFHYKDCPAKVLMELKNLSFGYNQGPILFSGLNFHIGKYDRIGIIGKNGKGKSTLLNVLAEELKGSGEVWTHPSLAKGHFGQTNVDRLHKNHSIIQEITLANPELSHTQVRNICGTMMFEGDLAEKKIQVLSGGERARVLLGKILAHPSNILLLDEPTNHLDIESVESLCEEIQSYPGAVVLVTHSEYLLRELVDKLIVFHRDRCEVFKGSYDEFLAKIGWEDEAELAAPKKQKFLPRKELKKRRQEIILERSQTCGPLKREVEKIEEHIISLEEQVGTLNTALEALDSTDNEKLMEITQKIGQLHIQIQTSYEELEPKALKLENLTTEYDSKLAELEG